MINIIFIAHWIGEPVEMAQVGGLIMAAWSVGFHLGAKRKGARMKQIIDDLRWRGQHE